MVTRAPPGIRRAPHDALAAGVAHELNNLLTAIIGHAGLLRMTLDASGSELLEDVDRIEAAARRAAEVCQQLVAMSGNARGRQSVLDLRDLVAPVAARLREGRADLEVIVEPGHAVASVHADGEALGHALGQIAALTAASASVGTVTVRVTVFDPTPAWLRARGLSDLPRGRYAQLEVHDDGSPADPAEAVTPFGSLRGVATRLGVVASEGVARAHGGALTLEDNPAGTGMIWRLLLPARGDS